VGNTREVWSAAEFASARMQRLLRQAFKPFGARTEPLQL